MHWILEHAVDQVSVINARHMRNVPGRKTDVADAQWGAQLIEHGLVRASFVPPRPTREQRDLTRYRESAIEEIHPIAITDGLPRSSRARRGTGSSRR